MPSENTIGNGMFVWGNASARASDLADLEIDEAGFVAGAKAGDPIYSDVLNSGLRAATLLSYAFVEAIKAGPEEKEVYDLDGGTDESNLPWLGESLSFSYKIADESLGDFCEALSSSLRAYVSHSPSFISEYSKKSMIEQRSPLSGVFPLLLSEGISSSEGEDYITPKWISGKLAYDAQSKSLLSPGLASPSIYGNFAICETSPTINEKSIRIDGFYPHQGCVVNVLFLSPASIRNYQQSGDLTLAIADGAGASYRYPVKLSFWSNEKQLRDSSLWAGGDIVPFVIAYAEDSSLAAFLLKPSRSGVAFAECLSGQDSAAKEASSPGFKLVDGAVACVHFRYGNFASDATLSINGTQASPIYLNASRTSWQSSSDYQSSTWLANDTLLFAYVEDYSPLSESQKTPAWVEIGNRSFAKYAEKAEEADKLTLATAGSETKPVFIKNHVPAVAYERRAWAGEARVYISSPPIALLPRPDDSAFNLMLDKLYWIGFAFETSMGWCIKVSGHFESSSNISNNHYNWFKIGLKEIVNALIDKDSWNGYSKKNIAGLVSGNKTHLNDNATPRYCLDLPTESDLASKDASVYISSIGDGYSSSYGFSIDISLRLI